MNTRNSLDDKVSIFEELVASSFDFLETEFGMRRRAVRISNRNSPRDVTAIVRYESDNHRIDIGWGIGENGLGVLIWVRPCDDTITIPKRKWFIYFEPFIEFLTGGSEAPIVPQVYPGMPISKLNKIMEERNKLFESPFPEIIARLARKLRHHFKNITIVKANTLNEFHNWMSVHR